MTSALQSTSLIFLLTIGSAFGQTQTASSPPACPSPQNSVDYVPGVNAQGAKVAPSDLPDTSDVKVEDQVNVRVQTKNSQMPSVDVAVKTHELDAVPCKSVSQERPVDAAIHIH